MKELVRREMQGGALGVGSSLIYAPAFYAKTDELVELCKVASEYGGMYISHMRSEGNQLLEAVDELIHIAREAEIPAEIYHLKAAGRENWTKMDEVIHRVESAREEGLKITADMYTYTAGSTGLNATMPPWVQEGGLQRWIARLRDPATRRRVMREMRTPTDLWENMFLAVGQPDNILLVGFSNPNLKHLTGKTLAEVAKRRGRTPEETAMDLVIEDNSRVQAVYFMMSEENIKKKCALPWVSLGSDAGSMAPEGEFLRASTHPRAYGNFARFLGRYVRDQRLIPLEEAIRRMTDLPASNLGIKQRGRLEPGYYADVVIFDPATIQDHATFAEPHQYATGVLHVLVNGQQVLKDGQHTGALPGPLCSWPRCSRRRRILDEESCDETRKSSRRGHRSRLRNRTRHRASLWPRKVPGSSSPSWMRLPANKPPTPSPNKVERRSRSRPTLPIRSRSPRCSNNSMPATGPSTSWSTTPAMPRADCIPFMKCPTRNGAASLVSTSTEPFIARVKRFAACCREVAAQSSTLARWRACREWRAPAPIRRPRGPSSP